jgi:hypothetical protein
MPDNNLDYTFRFPDGEDWIVRITIPFQQVPVAVISKKDLTLEEMLQYDKSEFTPEKPLINFYVENTRLSEPMVSFDPPLILEARGEQSDLGYLDLDRRKWIMFPDQDKQDNLVRTRIEQWAADPQVAWGK